MTLQEFKAWFEGYTEGLEAAPSKAQFERIKERVREIDGAPITKEIFVHRYWPAYFGQPYTDTPYYGGIGIGAGQIEGQAYSIAKFGQFSYAEPDAGRQGQTETIDWAGAMYAAGKAEAQAA